MSRKIVGITVGTPLSPERIVEKTLENIEVIEGKSAYEIALENGFEGTEAEWLESLKGKDGKDGKDGVDGYTPVKGENYFTEEDTQAIVDDVCERLNGNIAVAVDDELSLESENPVQNKVITATLENKVSKENGKGLSEENFTKSEKEKLAKLDPESMKFPTLPEDGSVLVVQANLAQNDPTQPDYVKNRPFYEKEGKYSFFDKAVTPNPMAFQVAALGKTFYKVSDLTFSKNEILNDLAVTISYTSTGVSSYTYEESNILFSSSDGTIIQQNSRYIYIANKLGTLHVDLTSLFGIVLTINVPETGTYFSDLNSINTFEISSGYEFKQIDPKFLPFSVVNEVNSGEKNAVSSDAVYKHTVNQFKEIENLSDKTRQLESQTQELAIKVEGATTPDLDENNENVPGYIKGRKFYDYKPYPNREVAEGQEPKKTINQTVYQGRYRYDVTVKAYLIDQSTSYDPQYLIGATLANPKQFTIQILTEKDLQENEDGSFIFNEHLAYVPEDTVASFNLRISGDAFVSLTLSAKGLYSFERYYDMYDNGAFFGSHTSFWPKISMGTFQKTLDSKYLTLENDLAADSSNPPTTQAVKKEIDGIRNKISCIYRYCGTVEFYTQLPTEGNEIGDTYNVLTAHSVAGIKDGDNVAWDGEKWDVLAGLVDLSAYAKTSAIQEVSKTVEEVSKAIEEVNKNKVDFSNLGIAEGVATLDEEGYIPDEQIPPSMKEDVVIEGYYNKVNSLFFEDETFTNVIEGKTKKFYLDKTQTVLYIFNGSAFLPLAGGFREEDYLTDEEFEDMMGEMGI